MTRLSNRIGRWLALGLGFGSVVLLGTNGCHRPPAAEVGTRLREFVGAPARLVWLRQVDGNGNDPLCWGNGAVLMGLDTEDGRGIRTIVAAVTNYHRPMVTPDGRQVVFSRHSTREAFVVDWQGGQPRRIGSGYAAAVWRDPDTDLTWVYLTDNGREGRNRHDGRAMHRVRLDNPTVRELVWDREKFTFDNWQLSADGTRASGQFNHPRAGYAELPNRSWTHVGRGCWTSMAPDNSYWVWFFDNPHRNLTLHDPKQGISWKVPINTAPVMNGFEVYHPRWSNRRSFFTLTGPYTVGQAGQNLIRAGGPQVEIAIGQFADDLKSVANWLQITHDDRGDFYPDLWIAPAAATGNQ